MFIHKMQEPDPAIAQLSRRSLQSLGTFIVSLVHDNGPIGEHARTFIVDDNLAETITSLNTASMPCATRSTDTIVIAMAPKLGSAGTTF
jgi:hypothetical protein